MAQEDLLRRITARPNVFGGKPIIGGMRISVGIAGMKADRSIRHFSFELPSSVIDVSSKRSASKVELQF